MTKAHILDEIRRTAATNGGEALGRKRFETETGIRQIDCSNFWARWGDAVREAGLAPKEFTVAYERSKLLDLYAGLAREIARIPAWSDLSLKDYNDSEFPSAKVFRRFGSMQGLLKEVVEHCRAKRGWDDVAGLCSDYVPRRNAATDEAAPAKDEEIGFVYLIRSSRFYKIGKTNSAGRRERELTIQLPEKASTVHVIRTDDPSGIESYWHRRFDGKRKNGERFELTADDVRAFKRRKFM